MASSGQLVYTFRTPYPDMLTRGRAQRVAMYAERDGATVDIVEAGSTFTLTGPDGTKVIDAVDVTVGVDGGAYVDLAAEDLPDTLRCAVGYLETWDLVLPDDSRRQVDREAFIGLRPLHPPAGVSDLLERKPGLNSLKGNEIGSLQPFIDGAWKDHLGRLVAEGEFPSRIKSGWAYRPSLVELALAFFFEWLHSRQPTAGWDAIAKEHRAAYEVAWKSATVVVDRDDDGAIDDGTRRRGGSGTVVHLNGAPTTARGPRGRNPSWLG